MGIATKIDITPADLKTLQALLKRYIPQSIVWAFGSRVKFTNKPSSDLDLVAFTTKEQNTQVSLLKDAIEEAMLPYRVDLLCWHEIPENFKKNIEQQYVVVQEANIKENSLPKGWKIYSLADICNRITDGTHFSPKEVIEGNRIIATVRDMTEYGFDIKDCKRISEDDYKDAVKNGCKPEEGDVLFSKDGTMGIVQFFKGNYELVLLSSIAILKPNKSLVDGKFLSYYLKNPVTNNYIKENFKSGSALPRIVLKDLKKLDLVIPENISTQTAIAQILTSLDDKIELNLQMNQTLEAMAQAIFKEWFVEFKFPKSLNYDSLDLPDEQDSKKENQKEKNHGNQDNPKNQGSDNGLPKGWKEVSLNDVIDLIIDHRGKTPIKLGGQWSDEGITALSAKNVKDGKLVNLQEVGYVDEELYDKWMKEKLNPFDILLTSEAPLGEVSVLISNTRFCLSQRLFAIRTNDKCKPTYLYSFLRSKIGKENIQKRATGSTVVGIRQSELRNVEILLPEYEIQMAFEQVVKPLLIRIDENYNEINILTQTRDALLPKLMSGSLNLDLLD